MEEQGLEEARATGVVATGTAEARATGVVATGTAVARESEKRLVAEVTAMAAAEKAMEEAARAMGPNLKGRLTGLARCRGSTRSSASCLTSGTCEQPGGADIAGGQGAARPEAQAESRSELGARCTRVHANPDTCACAHCIEGCA